MYMNIRSSIYIFKKPVTIMLERLEQLVVMVPTVVRKPSILGSGLAANLHNPSPSASPTSDHPPPQ